MKIKIGSFNVKNLSENNKFVKRKLDIVAEIITRERFDIIALQEVLDNGDIIDGGLGKRLTGKAKVYDESLKARLPKQYDVRWGASNVKKGGDQRGEGYAFIWNIRRVELAKQVTPNGKIVFNPTIWGHYSLQKAGVENKLRRNPFYGRFKLKNTKHEIRLITTHICFDSVSRREDELHILAGCIYPRAHDERYGVNTPSTTILLGDYNLNLRSSGAGNPYLNSIIVVDEYGFVRKAEDIWCNKNIRTFETIQNQKSTLSRVSEDEEYSNNYDHITYETSEGGNHSAHDREAIVNTHVIRVSDMPGIDFEEYREKVSDHLPICVELKL